MPCIMHSTCGHHTNVVIEIVFVGGLPKPAHKQGDNDKKRKLIFLRGSCYRESRSFPEKREGKNVGHRELLAGRIDKT